MKNGLFNRKAYGLPAGAAEVFAAPVVQLNYARHAFEESRADLYGVAELPGSVEIVTQDVVEIQVAEGKPVKGIVRFPYSDDLDLVLVLVPEGKEFFVKTVWFNRESDNHKTLRLAPYSRP